MANLTLMYSVEGSLDPDGMPEVLETGFEFEARPHTLDECVEAMAMYPLQSDDARPPAYLLSEPVFDETTGLTTQYFLHPAKDAISQRLWATAWACIPVPYVPH